MTQFPSSYQQDKIDVTQNVNIFWKRSLTNILYFILYLLYKYIIPFLI